jgi:CRP/FNR family transcriptional regulator, cyclic AMP receptor protein
MADLLTLSAHLPPVDLEPGAFLLTQGEQTGSVWVLESGSVEVMRDDVLVTTIVRPGAFFGEVAAILETRHTASVRAIGPCRARLASNGRSFLLDNPEVLLLVAAGLAERLDTVTGYLVDLRNQYTDAPGISMVSTVLGALIERVPEPVRTGSLRDPDPEY